MRIKLYVKARILFVSIVLMSFFPPASAQTLQWAKGLNNSVFEGDNVSLGESGTDAAGNTIVVGQFTLTADFDPGTGTAYLTSNGGTDFFVAKYDASGNYVFAIKVGGLNNESVSAMSLDATGNIYVGGSYSGIVDFNAGPSVNNLSGGSTGRFLAKYDASGNYVWANGFAGITFQSMTMDVNAHIAVTGTYTGNNIESTGDFDPGVNTFRLPHAGSTDIFFGKYDADGNFEFAKGVGSTENETAYDIALDANDNIIITGGFFVSTLDFDPGPGTASLTSTDEFAYVAKYDATGNYITAFMLSGATSTGYELAVDATGSIYVGGVYTGTIDFDPGAGVANLTNSGLTDVFIAKYTTTGVYTFAKKLGGTGSDSLYSMILDGSANIFVSGTFAGTVDFDPNAGTQNLVSAGNTDAFFAKYSTTGTYTFARKLGGTINDAPAGITLDASGNIVVTGNFQGTVDFDPGAGTTNLVCLSTQDVFLAKYNSAGNYVYAKQVGALDQTGNFSDQGNAITVDAAGNIYTLGIFSGTVDFDPGAGIANLTAGTGVFDIFFAKHDADGNYVFAKRLGNTSSNNASAIRVDASGNIYITGSYSGTLDFNPDGGVANLTSGGGTDIYLAKYDNAGAYLFAKSIGSTGADIGSAIAFDQTGEIILTGGFTGTVNFNPGGTAVNLTSGGGSDIFIAKYSTLGACVFAKRVGGANSDQGRTLACDNSGNIYIAGVFAGTNIDFDPGAGSSVLSTVSNSLDIFFAKYDNSGNHVFAKSLAGSSSTSNSESPNSIALDNNGNIYLAGGFTGITDFDPGPGSLSLASAATTGPFGGYTIDIFLAKYTNSGDMIYAKKFGGTGTEDAKAVLMSGIDVYITGSFSSTSIGFGLGLTTVYDDADGYYVRFDAAGNMKECYTLQGANNQLIYAAAIAPDGSILLTGANIEACDFDPFNGVAMLQASNAYDIFIAKYNQNSTVQFDVTGVGTNICEGTQVPIGLSGSIVGMNYYLRRDWGAAMAQQSGTGGPLNFGNFSTPGVYRVSTNNPAQTVTNMLLETLLISPEPLPVTPNANAQLFCIPNPTVGDLVAAGTDIKWYQNANGGIPLDNSMLLNSTTYYVTQTSAAGCESIRWPVKVTIGFIPVVNDPADQNVCAGTTTSVSYTGSGYTYNWTNDNTAIGLAASGTGNIGAFNAVNNTASPVVANITVTPETKPDYAYIPNYSNHTVSVVNLRTNAVTATIPVGLNPMTSLVSPDNSKVYIVNSGSNSVSVISTSTNTVTATITTGNLPMGIGITPDGSKVFVSNNQSSTVSVINAFTNTLITNVNVGLGPGGLVVSRDGTRVYVANRGSNNVTVFSAVTYNLITTVTVAGFPTSVAIHPDNSKVYITNASSNTVSVINTSSFAVSSITVGTSPWGVSVNPEGSKIFVTNRSSDNVSVINALTNVVMTTIPVGSQPHGVCVSFDGTYVLVSNYMSGNCSVISTATNAVTGTITVGAGPYSFGNFILTGGLCNNGATETFTITVNPVTALANSLDVTSLTFAGLSETHFIETSGCRIISSVTPNGANPISGNVTAKVWVESTIPGYGNEPFVARHYEIIPTNNPSTSTGRVKLYFTQQEFNDFNADAGSISNLPTSSSDVSGKENLRVYRYPGTSSDGSGLPFTYNGTPMLIDPENADIVWNASFNRWEVSFDVTGFGGFTIGTTNTLLFCPGGSFEIPAGASGTTYQWQQDNGGGYVNINDGINYTGTSTPKLTLINLPTNSYGHRYRCLVDGIPSTVYTARFVVVWMGNADSDWQTASNWASCGVVPDQYTDVEIPAGRTNYPVLNISTTIRSIKVNPGTSVIVQGGVILNIVGQ